MIPSDLIRTLAYLRRRRVRFDRAALRAFVTDFWLWIEDDPDDLERWAGEFLAGCGLAA